MKRFVKIGLSVFSLLLVIGCSPAAPTPTLPAPPSPTPSPARPTVTRPPNIEVVPAATRLLPPTWTPIPAATATPVLFEDAIPTATPRISITPSPSPTYDYEKPPLPLRGTKTLPAECANFRIEKGASSSFYIRIRDEMHIVWNAINNPAVYWVWVRHPDGRYIVREAVNKPTIDIKNPSGTTNPVFNAEGVYPVVIVAFRNGEPVCQQITDVIIVQGRQ
jgi:hypothetical protein